MTVEFSEPIAAIGEGDISLVEATGGCIAPDHVLPAPGGQWVTLIFEGGLPPVAGRNTYSLRVLDTVTDRAGNVLDGDADGAAGGDYAIAFSVLLAGDANADGLVGIADLAALADHYGQHDADWADGDFNGDGLIGIADLVAFADYYGRSAPYAGEGTPQAALLPQERVVSSSPQVPMSHLNVEIKARCSDPDRIRRVLAEHGADFKGTDRQVDTYFNCAQGRLKLREGNIQYALIHYDRPDRPGPKEAHVTLYHPPRDPALKQALARALGVKVVVEKTREIRFIENVKFHIDDVDGLGGFVEIEAIDADGSLGPAALHAQCRHYMDLFGIDPLDLIDTSYSDLLLARGV